MTNSIRTTTMTKPKLNAKKPKGQKHRVPRVTTKNVVESINVVKPVKVVKPVTAVNTVAALKNLKNDTSSFGKNGSRRGL